MSTEQPVVTVITPTYNRPDYLEDTIRSVLGQTMHNWEMIIVNDGGVDVQERVDRVGDARIIYHNRPVNQGKAACLNFALSRARGTYVAYIDDDDIWYPHHLETLARALDANPAIGAVYSDLYAVIFIRDTQNGRRYPVHKSIQVARDFNRDFMFYINHTLHVSLMHRTELAFRVGGYHEGITVLIDWNITRKLCFITDFKYIPVVTGEYYMPVGKSDRISNLEREDKDRFRHNLRKIRADLPPEPWPFVERVAVILPVSEWDEHAVQVVTSMTDKIYYPVHFLLINNDRDRSSEDCRKVLGGIGELTNVKIVTPPRPLTPLEAYRHGAKRTNARYVYLATLSFDPAVEMRLIKAMHHIQLKGKQAVRWDAANEKDSPFDMLLERELFLKRSKNASRRSTVKVDCISPGFPESLRFDVLLSQAKRGCKEGNFDLAYRCLKEAATIEKGAGGEQFMVDMYAKVCFELKKYAEAESQCRELIERGYGADNWIRLGKIMQIKGRLPEAVDAYRRGLDAIGLHEEDLQSPVFPVVMHEECGSFMGMLGLAECLMGLGDLAGAAKRFRCAAKIKANTHRAYLGFGALFLKTGEWDKAQEALSLARRRNRNDPRVIHLLGVVSERRGALRAALEHYLAAFKRDRRDWENVKALCRVGAALERWEEVEGILGEFLTHRPGHVAALETQARICSILGREDQARHCRDRAEVLGAAAMGAGGRRPEVDGDGRLFAAGAVC